MNAHGPKSGHDIWRREYMRPSKRIEVYLGCLVLLFSNMPTSGMDGIKIGEWRFYGGDAGGTKYSPLDQINRDNVKTLKVAWTWNSPDLKILEQNQKLFVSGFEVTPIMVDGVLYVSTSLSQVAAINAQTGKT